MTGREKNLLIIVGVIMVAGLGYNLFQGTIAPSGTGAESNSDLEGVNRLLRSRGNINSRNQAVAKRLDLFQAKFYDLNKPEEARIALLKEVEGLVALAGLEVNQKNLVQFSKNEIGVALEGKGKPESVFKFIWQTTQAKTGLKLHRFQAHSLSDQKLLNYQIVVTTLLMDKKGK